MYIYILNNHVYVPAQLLGSFTLSDRLDEPWSQVPSLPPPWTYVHFFRA